MKPRLCRIAIGIALTGMVCARAAEQTPLPQHPLSASAAGSALTPEEQALHVLNRLGYGPRPGEVRAVAAEGIETWINRQLDPESIPDPVANATLAKLGTLPLPCSTVVAAFRQEALIRRERQKKAGEDASKSGSRLPNKIPPQLDPPEVLVATALAQLQEAKLIRAVLSERQLNEVLVDFWFNHFNVDSRKELDRATVEAYERDTIRAHVWGTFRDLLEATAKSPAMLVYLDNWQNSRSIPLGPKHPPGAVSQRGINENYGREVMELHTLGVDGGYTQKDVQEVARCFTGWSINPKDGAFLFRPYWHDRGAKVVLGVRIPTGGGMSDGERVIDLLSTSPATAHHIAFELCQRFVADDPPQALVDRVASVFLSSGGSLPAVYRCLFTSPEFLEPRYAGNKIKSPFEFIASALRATGATIVPTVPNPPSPHAARAMNVDLRPAKALRRTTLAQLFAMGQTPYAWAPPTGFTENSSRWVSAGALVQRLNFSLAYAGGWFLDARPNLRALIAGSQPDSLDSVVATLDQTMLASTLTPATRNILYEQSIRSAHGANPVPNIPRLVALILGSPEFQHR